MRLLVAELRVNLHASVAVTHSFNRQAWIAMCGAVGHPNSLSLLALVYLLPFGQWSITPIMMHTDERSPKSLPRRYGVIIFLHQSKSGRSTG